MALSNILKFVTNPYRGFSKNTWKLLGAGFVNAWGMTLTIYLTLYLNLLGFPLSKVGCIITFFSLGGLLGGYLGGWLTDKLSALNVCKLSLIISSAFICSIGINKNFYSLAGIAIFTGIFSNLFRPAFILALTDEGKSSSLEKIIALRRVAINLGMAFGAAILGFIASISYTFLFCILGIANLLAFIMLPCIIDTGNIKNCSNKIGEKEISKAKGFYIVLILMFLITIIFNQTQITYPLFLKNNLNISIHFISMLFALNGILIAIFQMPITNRLSKQNTNYTCAIGAFLLSIGLAILPFCNSKISLMISCSIWTLGEIIFYPAILALVIKLSGSKKGKSMGLYQLFFSLASFAAPVIGTTFYGYNKNYIWYASFILGIIITLYFSLSIKKTDTKFIKFSTIEEERA